MNGFFISKRKTFEILLLLLLNAFFILIWKSWDFVILYSLGYVWNWVASQESSFSLENNRRYRFSTLKTVFNLQNLFLKPFSKFPEFVRILIKCLPAGLFWTAVIYFIESEMPWWAVFLGSLSMEIVLLEKKILTPKEQPPMVPEEQGPLP